VRKKKVILQGPNVLLIFMSHSVLN